MLSSLDYQYINHPTFLGVGIDDVNQCGANGDAMLHIACQIGSIRDVKLLIDSGADFMLRGEFSNTPLHYAGMFGFADIWEYLIEKGVQAECANDFGELPQLQMKGAGVDYSSQRSPEGSKRIPGFRYPM